MTTKIVNIEDKKTLTFPSIIKILTANMTIDWEEVEIVIPENVVVSSYRLSGNIITELKKGAELTSIVTEKGENLPVSTSLQTFDIELPTDTVNTAKFTVTRAHTTGTIMVYLTNLVATIEYSESGTETEEKKNIIIGDKIIKSIYIGDKIVSKVYLGNKCLF